MGRKCPSEGLFALPSPPTQPPLAPNPPFYANGGRGGRTGAARASEREGGLAGGVSPPSLAARAAARAQPPKQAARLRSAPPNPRCVAGAPPAAVLCGEDRGGACAAAGGIRSARAGSSPSSDSPINYVHSLTLSASVRRSARAGRSPSPARRSRWRSTPPPSPSSTPSTPSSAGTDPGPGLDSANRVFGSAKACARPLLRSRHRPRLGFGLDPAGEVANPHPGTAPPLPDSGFVSAKAKIITAVWIHEFDSWRTAQALHPHAHRKTAMPCPWVT
jgi:hypothetical protein